jgi:hypothetical protein
MKLGRKNVIAVVAAAVLSLVGAGIVKAQYDGGVQVLIGTTAPNGSIFPVQVAAPLTLVQGNLGFQGRFTAVTSEAGSFTAKAGQSFYETSSSASTATLPSAATAGVGAEIHIHNSGSSTVTMAVANGTDTVAGGAAGSTTIATTTTKTFLSDGVSDWKVE